MGNIIDIYLFIIGMVGFGSLVRHEILSQVSRFPIMSNTALFIAEIPSNLNQIAFTPHVLKTSNRFPNILEFEETS